MNNYKLNLKNEVFINFIVTISTLSFIFLSGIKFEYFQLRIIIISLLFFSILKFIEDIRKKNFYSLKIFIFLLLLLCLQLLANLFSENFKFTYYQLYGYIYFFSLFVISYYFTSEISEKLLKILSIFYILLLASSILGIYSFFTSNNFFVKFLP